ncbi:hypothetical protein O6H91_21G061900 [Diphasiastrum complanatum]|nr:hypothetical protein O6H91_21G061900 [Diphasiastrum complanatum]
MAFSSAACKFWAVAFIAAFVAVAVAPSGVWGRPLSNPHGASDNASKTFSMEVDDLSFEQQQKVIDLGMRFDVAKRQLLAKDPYSTNY